MAVQFILGRAGTGKSYACAQAIADQLTAAPLGPPLIFIVPEQATFQVERSLAFMLPGRGYSRLQVYSFTRLAMAILAETGGMARPALTLTGRCMLLRLVLQEQKDNLTVFAKSARQAGMLTQLDKAISELAQHGHAPADLRATAAGLPGSAGLKLADIALIWESYRTALTSRYADASEFLSRAAQAAGAASLLQQAQVWVDGFSSFTPQEYQMLAALTATVSAVHVALCTAPKAPVACTAPKAPVACTAPLVPIGLFRQAEETQAHVADIWAVAGAPRLPDMVCTTARRFQQPELAHLEQEYGHLPPRPWSGPAPGIRLVEAANRRCEVEAVAADILRLCRTRHLRFRDIAIIVRDLEPYHELIAAVFAAAGIPYFIDRRSALPHHPAVEFIRSGMETVLSNFSIRPLLRCLKTDLVPLSRAQVDKLENYVLQYGLHGSAWQDEKPWQYGRHGHDAQAEATLTEIDASRRQAVAILQPLQRLLRQPKITAVAGCRALVDLLENAAVQQTLSEWEQAATTAGQHSQALLHRQVWERLINLIQEVYDILGDTELAPAEFQQVVESGLESLQLGLIPPALDQVLVGAVDRSRQPELRAAYVLGLVDKEFPAASAEDAIFSDMERQMLADTGFSCGPAASESILNEKYFGYIALTRASQHLWVSRPLAGDAGRELMPSPFFTWLTALYPEAPVLRGESEPPQQWSVALPFLTSARRLSALLVRSARAGNMGGDQKAIAELLTANITPDVEHVLAALRHSNSEPPLPAQAQERLLRGSDLPASVSRLESFAACPFQHFARYMLGLRERSEFRIQNTDIGALVHDTLHRFVRTIKQQEIDWADLPATEAQALVAKLVAELAPRLRSEIMLSNARHRYLAQRVERTMNTAIWVLGEHARSGSFRPIATELGFGGPHDALPAWRLQLPGGYTLALQGRIDRVDAAKGGATTYIRVIDYKGASADFSLADVYYGLRLQLMVYLQVALEAWEEEPSAVGAPVRAAGAYYFAIHDQLIDTTEPLSEVEIERQLLKALRLQGISLGEQEAVRLAEPSGAGLLIPAKLKNDGDLAVHALTLSAEELSQLCDSVRMRLVDLAQQILHGEVAVAPYRYPRGENACTFCPYLQVCLFDPRVAGNAYRTLEYRENRSARQFIAATQED